MTIKLYELAGQGDAKISPHCWKSVYAVFHKELEFERIGISYFEKDRLDFSGQKLVPVLQDGEAVVCDSWAIAEYLEETYPARPSLFGGEIGKGEAKFINDWTNAVQIFAFRRLFILDAHDTVKPEEQAHYRATREARYSEEQKSLRPDVDTAEFDVAPPDGGYGGGYGVTLEAMQADRETRILAVRNLLEPIRTVLAAQPFLSGASPAYADYSVLGPFIWGKSVSSFALLEPADPIYAWRDRMYHLFDDLGHRTGHPV
jgi:glutathione S-transferase